MAQQCFRNNSTTDAYILRMCWLRMLISMLPQSSLSVSSNTMRFTRRLTLSFLLGIFLVAFFGSLLPLLLAKGELSSHRSHRSADGGSSVFSISRALEDQHDAAANQTGSPFGPDHNANNGGKKTQSNATSIAWGVTVSVLATALMIIAVVSIYCNRRKICLRLVRWRDIGHPLPSITVKHSSSSTSYLYSTSKKFDSTGGILTIGNGLFQMIVPPLSMSAREEVEIEVNFPRVRAKDEKLLKKYLPLAPIIELKPHNQRFKKPIQIIQRLNRLSSDPNLDVDESQIQLLHCSNDSGEGDFIADNVMVDKKLWKGNDGFLYISYKMVEFCDCVVCFPDGSVKCVVHCYVCTHDSNNSKEIMFVVNKAKEGQRKFGNNWAFVGEAFFTLLPTAEDVQFTFGDKSSSVKAEKCLLGDEVYFPRPPGRYPPLVVRVDSGVAVSVAMCQQLITTEEVNNTGGARPSRPGHHVQRLLGNEAALCALFGPIASKVTKLAKILSESPRLRGNSLECFRSVVEEAKELVCIEELLAEIYLLRRETERSLTINDFLKDLSEIAQDTDGKLVEEYILKKERLRSRGQGVEKEDVRHDFDCSGNYENEALEEASVGSSSSPATMTSLPILSPASFPVVAPNNDGIGSRNDRPDSPRPGDYFSQAEENIQSSTIPDSREDLLQMRSDEESLNSFRDP